MDAEEEIKKIIFKYLSPKEYKVFLFGSRAAGYARRFSDWDIGVLGRERIPFGLLAEIEGELEDSYIPYEVDVVDLNSTSDKFRRLALKSAEQWTN